MDINKAIQHFKYKLTNSWKPTKFDIEAYNAILEYKELQESINISKNESLAKLWIHQLMLLSNTNCYNGERSIQVIDEILEKSVYEWCLKLKEQLPMMRFNSIGLDKYPLTHGMNQSELMNRNNKIIDEFETELTEAMIHEPKEEDIIKFVQFQINRIVNKFEIK